MKRADLGVFAAMGIVCGLLAGASVAIGHSVYHDDCDAGTCQDNNDWDGHDHFDQMTARGGDDTLRAQGNFDFFYLGLNSDIANGDGGADTIHGDDGNDKRVVGPVTTYNSGDVGDDILYGEEHSDAVKGGENEDQIHGGNGDDLIWASGDGDRDEVWGGAGQDTCSVGPADIVHDC